MQFRLRLQMVNCVIIKVNQLLRKLFSTLLIYFLFFLFFFTIIISVTLGGFGIDRFYLGYWQEGIGKLFSFGGFGVWTLVDIILISTGYLKPADGSRYINDFSFS